MVRTKKNARTTAKGAMVVYTPQKSSSAPKGKKKKRSNELESQGAYLAAYSAAIMDPFAPRALGARVPDMYSQPTVPKSYSVSFTIGTTSGGSSNIIVLPNVYMPLICLNGAATGATTWTTMDGVNSGAAYINPTANISSQLVNYRIVGYGIRMYCPASITAASGRVLVATTAVSSWVNNKNAPIGGQTANSTNANASVANTLKSYGIPNSGSTVDVAALSGMQSCIETSLVGMAANPLTVVPHVTSPEAFNFRQSEDSSIGFDINNQSSASYISSGDASYLKVNGHELVVISISGAPISSNVLQMEIIYHLEGTPAYTALTGTAPEVVASPNTMADIIAKAARSSPFKQGVETIGNTIFPGLGTMARAILQ